MIRQSNAYELNSISRQSHLQITNQPHTVTRSLTDLNLKTHEQFISRSCFEFHKKIRLHIQPTQSFPIIRLPERQQITKGEHSVTWGTPLKMRSIVLWGCVVEQSWAASTFWKNMFRVFIPWRWRRYVRLNPRCRLPLTGYTKSQGQNHNRKPGIHNDGTQTVSHKKFPRKKEALHQWHCQQSGSTKM